MQVYNGKTTREDKPAPEIQWIIGSDIQIIGFDNFNCQIKLSVARLNGEYCHVPDGDSTAFFTEVPAAGYFDDAVRDTEVIIDTEYSQSHLLVHTEDIEYTIKKIPHFEPLEFREQYLPIDQCIAKGSIQREKLYQCIKLSPDESLQVEVSDGIVKFISETINDKIHYTPTDINIKSHETESSYSFNIEYLSEAVKNIPKEKYVQFFITEEFLRLRYELGDIGYMNYYQRNKNGGDIYVI